MSTSPYESSLDPAEVTSQKSYPAPVVKIEGGYDISLPMTFVNPDRVQYKPYGLGFNASSILYIQVTVDDDEVVEATDQWVKLTPAGAAKVAGQICDAIDEVHSSFKFRGRQFS